MKPSDRAFAKPLPNSSEFRVPPQDLEAEVSVLGSMILSDVAVIDCRAILKAEDFYREAHRKLYQAIVALDDRREPVDTTTLSAELKRMGEFEAIGGLSALTSVIERVPTAANAEYYANIVKEKAQGRMLIQVLTKGIAEAYQDSEKPEGIMDWVTDNLTRNTTKTGVVGSYQVAHEILSDWDKKQAEYIPTEWNNLNYVLKGLRKGTVITVTGPSYNGKSTFVQNLSVQIARTKKEDKQPYKVLHMAFEGTRKEVAKRQICLMSNIRLPVLDSTDETLMAMNKKTNAAAKWADLKIVYGDKFTMGREWKTIRPNIIREIKRNGVEVIFIEGGEKIVCRPEYGEEKWSAQERFVEELDDVARIYQVPIIVIVGQSASGAEGMNKSKREGGTYNWSKVADQRIYVKRLQGNLNLVEVTKNRDGPKGKCYFEGTEDTYRWIPTTEPEGQTHDEHQH